MLARNLLVAASLLPACEGILEDDVTLLSSGTFELSDEYLTGAPEMAMVQVDVAESIISFFHPSDALGKSDAQVGDTENVATAIGAQAEATARGATQGQEHVDLAKLTEAVPVRELPPLPAASDVAAETESAEKVVTAEEIVTAPSDAQAEAAVPALLQPDAADSQRPTDLAMMQMSATETVDKVATSSTAADGVQGNANDTTMALETAMASSIAMVQTGAAEASLDMVSDAAEEPEAQERSMRARYHHALVEIQAQMEEKKVEGEWDEYHKLEKSLKDASDVAMLETNATDGSKTLAAVEVHVASDAADGLGASTIELLNAKLGGKSGAKAKSLGHAVDMLEKALKNAKKPQFINPHPIYESDWKIVTFTQKLSRQIEHELQIPEMQPQKDKRILATLTAFVLPAFFGIDRCYMGQYLLGLLKAMTFGGCAFWALFDYCYVMYNCIMEQSSMHWLLFRANFADSSVYGAFYIAVFGLFSAAALSLWTPERKQEKL